MGFSKANLYEKDDQLITAFFKAFSHPARAVIIRKLSKDGPCDVDQLSKLHPISKTSLSGHLKILRKAHLITYKVKYPKIIYSIEGKYLALAEAYMKLFFKSL